MNFTYKKDMENQKQGILQALEILESLKKAQSNVDQVNTYIYTIRKPKL